eukprot:scaffold909_cov135-Cylindrotheca_fusiformis.AAC.32
MASEERLLSFPATAAASHVDISISPKSYMAQDIVKITHLQAEAKVIIQLRSQRACRQPQLIGRLSGPALEKLVWEKETSEDVMIGSYHAPIPGRYFLEIIVIMCTAPEKQIDYRRICPVKPELHRLTIDEAFVDVVHVKPTIEPRFGYWYNKNQTMQDPLYTRYQPQGCRNGTAQAEPRCLDFMSVTRFEPYEFRYTDPYFSLEDSLRGKEGKLCFEGASHSRELSIEGMNLIRGIEGKTGVRVATTHNGIITKYPKDFNQERIQHIIHHKKCNKVIVAFGQHDLGGRYSGTSFLDFEAGLQAAMKNMSEQFSSNNIDLYFRGMQTRLTFLVFCISYNPLGDLKTLCPPKKDWRTPPIVDMLDKITRDLCEKLDITFIDTDHIIGIMWDRAEDWCHYRDTSGKIEAEYYLKRMFE